VGGEGEPQIYASGKMCSTLLSEKKWSDVNIFEHYFLNKRDTISLRAKYFSTIALWAIQIKCPKAQIQY